MPGVVFNEADAQTFDDLRLRPERECLSPAERISRRCIRYVCLFGRRQFHLFAEADIHDDADFALAIPQNERSTFCLIARDNTVLFARHYR